MKTIASLASAALVVLATSHEVVLATEGSVLADGWNSFAQELAKRNLPLTDELAELLETHGQRGACSATDSLPPPPADRALVASYLTEVCRPSLAVSGATNGEKVIDDFFTTLTAHISHAPEGVHADTLMYASVGMLSAQRMSEFSVASLDKWAGMTMGAYARHATPDGLLKYAQLLVDSWADRSSRVGEVLKSYAR